MNKDKIMEQATFLSDGVLKSIGVEVIDTGASLCTVMKASEAQANDNLNILLFVIVELHITQLRLVASFAPENERLLALAKAQKHLDKILDFNVDSVRESLVSRGATIGTYEVPEHGS